MEVIKVGKRSIVFKYDLGDWNLYLHLIKGDKYNYLIDTGLGYGSIEPILEYLDDKELIVINTHYHFDHIRGNDYFRDKAIISSEKCLKLIDENYDDDVEKSGKYATGPLTKCLPNLVFQDELYFVEDKIRLFYSPGHTEDGISIYDEIDKVLNVGDNIGDDMEYIVPSLQCDNATYLNSLNKYKELDVEHCVSGHNEVLGSEVFDLIIDKLDSN